MRISDWSSDVCSSDRSSTHGERLGLPAPEQALCPRLGHLRRHPRRLSKRLALPRQRPRTNPLDRSPALGLCHSLRGLVLCRASATSARLPAMIPPTICATVSPTLTAQRPTSRRAPSEPDSPRSHWPQ